MVSARELLSAAAAALLVASPLVAQSSSFATATAPVPQDTALRSITLDDALQQARVVAPSVVQAQGSVRSSELSTRSAFMQFLPGLTVNPQMNLQLSNGRSRIDQVTGEIISGNSKLPSYSFGASATYTIFDGFARNYTYKQRKAQASAADAQLTAAQYNSDLSVTDAFFAALGQKQLVDVQRSNLAVAEGQLRLASAKLRSGSGQISDSLTALGGYLQAKLSLLQAQSTLIVDETNLGRLVGVAGRVAARDDSSFYRPPPALDTAAIRQEIMTASPTLRSLEANLTSAENAYSASKAAYYPTLTASGGLSWTGYWAQGSQSRTESGLTARRNLTLTLSISPWTNLTRETQIENASIQIANAEATLADERNQLAAQINQAYASLSTAQEQIAVTGTQVEAGQENLRVVTERYRIGAATITEVLAAQQQLITAEANQVQARYSYFSARAQLEQILGRKL